MAPSTARLSTAWTCPDPDLLARTNCGRAPTTSPVNFLPTPKVPIVLRAAEGFESTGEAALGCRTLDPRSLSTSDSAEQPATGRTTRRGRAAEVQDAEVRNPLDWGVSISFRQGPSSPPGSLLRWGGLPCCKCPTFPCLPLQRRFSMNSPFCEHLLAGCPHLQHQWRSPFKDRFPFPLPVPHAPNLLSALVVPPRLREARCCSCTPLKSLSPQRLHLGELGIALPHRIPLLAPWNASCRHLSNKWCSGRCHLPHHDRHPWAERLRRCRGAV